MTTQKNYKSKKSNKRFRKTRSKKQGGAKMPYVGRYYENPSLKLWDGVYEDDYKMVESAFKEGADVNIKNDNGVWFLLVASENGNARMVNLLLEKGIDVNITDDYNNTALSTAVRNANYDVVELLLENGADINKENNNGDTPLIHAINFGDIDMVQLLLENGADINKENNNGDTPLIHAINFGDIDMVQLLLEHPDINIELDLDTNKELRLAEELTPEDEEQNGIPYLIEDYIVTKNQIKKQKDDNIKELSNYKRPNISSLKTMAYHQSPSALDKYINLNPDTINRPYGKLGGKRRTRKSKRKTRKSKRPRRPRKSKTKKRK